MVDPDPRKVASETPAQARLNKRLGSRLGIGGLIGAVVGLIFGGVLSFMFFEGAGAFWIAALSGGFFGFLVGTLILGYSSLESPDPGEEPSDTQRPMADRPGAVREEHEHKAHGAWEEET